MSRFVRKRLREVLNRLGSESGLALLLIVIAFAILPFLAVVQYRWIGQVSEAERERMGANLFRSVWQLRHALDRELAPIQEPFAIDRRANFGESFEERMARCRTWLADPQHRALVRSFYLTRQTPRGHELYAYSPKKGAFEPAEWPESLRGLEHATPGPRPGFTPEVRAMAAPWHCEAPPPGDEVPPRGRPPVCGWVIAELDTGHLGRDILPELIDQHLGTDYQAEVIESGPTPRVVFRSSAGAIRNPDLVETLLPMWPEPGVRRFVRRLGGPGFPPGIGGPGRPPDRIDQRPGLWTLLVKHRAGSLEAAAARSRRLNLGVSAAILTVLAGCTALLHRSAVRDRRLAQQQMDFVAGVSHELRTPLSAARSLSENLADGLVHPDDRVKYYGRLLRDQTRGLSEMVEQILRLAGIQSGRAQFEFRRVDVSEILDRAVAAAEEEIALAGCRLEREIEEGLPPLYADAASLSHCVRNLLSNAVKYGKAEGLIKLAAHRGPNSFRDQVWISVEDNGPGIPRDEVKKIFRPFYRGKSALADQIHGIGLGLSLVKRVVEAHSGAVDVRTAPGEGSRFTLRIPAARGVE